MEKPAKNPVETVDEAVEGRLRAAIGAEDLDEENEEQLKGVLRMLGHEPAADRQHQLPLFADRRFGSVRPLASPIAAAKVRDLSLVKSGPPSLSPLSPRRAREPLAAGAARSSLSPIGRAPAIQT